MSDETDRRVNGGRDTHERRLGLGFGNNIEDRMPGGSIGFADAAAHHCDSGHGPLSLAVCVDAERIEALGAIIDEARRGAELRAEADI